MRAYRIDARPGSRFFDCASRSSTGSGRSGDGAQVAWLLRGLPWRAARPRSRRCRYADAVVDLSHRFVVTLGVSESTALSGCPRVFNVHLYDIEPLAK
jgi:hypothetical protein